MVRDVIGALGAGELSQRLPHVLHRACRARGSFELPIEESPPPITLAQVIPVSEDEYALWRENALGFEGLLEGRGIDVADLQRPG